MTAAPRQNSKTMRIDLLPQTPDLGAGGRAQVTVDLSAASRPVPSDPDAVPQFGAAYEELLQSIYDAVLLTDMEGTVVDANARAAEFLGHQRGDFCGCSVLSFIFGADDSLMRTLAEHIETQRYALIQAHCVRRDGSTFPAEVAVNRLQLLGAPHLCFFVRDVTVRRQQEAMLWTEHKAIQNAGNGIAVASVDGVLEYVNPAAARMWQAEPDAMLGIDVRELLADDVAADAMISAVMASQKAWSGEMAARRSDGSLFHVQVSTVCNRVGGGDAVGLVFSFVDISDRMRADQATREADRQRVMLESLGAACHHLGQPATVLLANLEMMQDSVRSRAGDVALKEMLKSSLEAIRRIGVVLHQLNSVNEYKTTVYASSADRSTVQSRIIQIPQAQPSGDAPKSP